MEQETTHAYEARRRRSVWADSVRVDTEIAALDEENGEWILCATCADHFRKTGRGRKPNDPQGFKVRMNGRFQEAAWLMHKNRVVAHRLVGGITPSRKRRLSSASDDLNDDSVDQNDVNATSAESEGNGNGPESGGLLVEPSQASLSSPNLYLPPPTHDAMVPYAIQIPLSGWKCPGIVPNVFYSTSGDLVHAFAKYYVGTYRVNVVRDLRTDRVLLYSHECENTIVQRERSHQSLACHKCHDVWVNHKSFRRILKKMERYNHVEAILRRAWSLNGEDLAALSRFKHASAATLTTEGRRLKQAAIDALNHYGSPARATVLPYESHLDLGFQPSTHHYASAATTMLPIATQSDTIPSFESAQAHAVTGTDSIPTANPVSDTVEGSVGI